MRSGYVDLAYLLVIGAVCGGVVFFMPEQATAIQLYDTYLAFAKWQLWLLLTVMIAFLFFAVKQALTGFRSVIVNRKR